MYISIHCRIWSILYCKCLLFALPLQIYRWHSCQDHIRIRLNTFILQANAALPYKYPNAKNRFITFLFSMECIECEPCMCLAIICHDELNAAFKVIPLVYCMCRMVTIVDVIQWKITQSITFHSIHTFCILCSVYMLLENAHIRLYGNNGGGQGGMGKNPDIINRLFVLAVGFVLRKCFFHYGRC